MSPGPPRRRRARLVADAPVDALLGRSEDLAKGWLLALIEQAPLDSLPAILASELARDAPRLCDAIVRALGDDDDLRRLEAGGVLAPLAARTGELAGASTAAATIRAVGALHAVVWGGVREELGGSPEPEQVAELAERLALVIEHVRVAAIAPGFDEPGRGVEPERRADPGPTTVRPLRAEPAPPAPEGPAPAAVAPPSAAPPPAAPPPAAPDPAAPPAATPDRQALWIGALEEELLRSQRAGARLSLLLAELEDADRMLAVEAPARANAMFGRFAQAVRDAVRRQDILASESETRAWVIARDTGRAGAQALAGRIAATVRAAPEWRGAPLSVSIGIAVLGEDGIESEPLIEAAEEARFAAAASGVGVISADPSPPPPSPSPSATPPPGPTPDPPAEPA
jgi:GGDEF domain-containing protein